MAPESKLGKDQPGATRGGFQVDKIRWEWPNPKGEGLSKLMPLEPIAGVLNSVGNAAQHAAQNGRRAWEGLLQQGIRSTNSCKTEFPKAWGGKAREVSQVEEQGTPTRASVVSTRYSTDSPKRVALISY